MEQRFEYGEIAATHLQLPDTALRIRLNSVHRLPHHQKDVYPGPIF
jgi:hypothetical protein